MTNCVPTHIRIAELWCYLPAGAAGEVMIRGIDGKLYFLPLERVHVPQDLTPTPGCLVSIGDDGFATLHRRAHLELPDELIDAQLRADLKSGQPVLKPAEAGALGMLFNHLVQRRLPAAA